MESRLDKQCDEMTAEDFVEMWTQFLDKILDLATTTLGEWGGPFGDFLGPVLEDAIGGIKESVDEVTERATIGNEEDPNSLCRLMHEIKFFLDLTEQGGDPGSPVQGDGCNMYAIAQVIKESVERWFWGSGGRLSPPLHNRLTTLNELLTILKGC
jgi:hypothetical protein